MKKRIEIDIELYGDGTIREEPGGRFAGGVPDPDRSGTYFTVHEELDSSEQPQSFEGNLQINVYGTSRGYRDLGRYLLALAELDTTADPDFHDHQDDLVSADGKATLHVIFHK